MSGCSLCQPAQRTLGSTDLYAWTRGAPSCTSPWRALVHKPSRPRARVARCARRCQKGQQYPQTGSSQRTKPAARPGRCQLCYFALHRTCVLGSADACATIPRAAPRAGPRHTQHCAPGARLPDPKDAISERFESHEVEPVYLLLARGAGGGGRALCKCRARPDTHLRRPSGPGPTCKLDQTDMGQVPAIRPSAAFHRRAVK